MDDRAQTFTLEALLGALLLLAAVGFALQAVSISSNTASIADTELRGQQVGLTDGVLQRTSADGNLTAVLLYWNESGQQFYDAEAEEGHYLSPDENSPFGNTSFGGSLERILDGSQTRYNINLHYRGTDGDRETQRLVETGTPGNNAVRIIETVTLTNETMLVGPDKQPRKNATLGAVAENFYAPNVSPERDLYNVIRVEVVVWQI